MPKKVVIRSAKNVDSFYLRHQANEADYDGATVNIVSNLHATNCLAPL